MSTSRCLMCDEEFASFWYSQNVPGSYCFDCIDVVVELHEFFERYNMELVSTLSDVASKGYDFNHKKAC